MKLTIGIMVCLQLCAQLLADPIPEQTAKCTESKFTVTADNQLLLYVDGVQKTGLSNANTWGASDAVPVSASASVIAVRGYDYGQIGGILASGAHAKTDHSWRCTATEEAGWTEVNFNDAHWPHATVIGDHGVSPWGTISGISADAKWIWTANFQYGPNSDHTVYCRKTRGCTHNTGPTCITSCDNGRANGDYQHCSRCDVYITCSNGILYDNRPCAPSNPALVWDDKVKRCEWKSTTCTPV